MKYSTPPYVSMIALLVLLTSTSIAGDFSSGCLIHQTNQTLQVKMTEGSIGQTFKPCNNGVLDYLTLFVESSNTESFTAELRVSKGSENISSQQFVIPANGSNPKVQAWFARPPKMVAGDDYLIELIVPNHQSFIAWYSDEDSYEQGRMTLNGLQVSGDLAFEAGVRIRAHQEVYKLERSVNSNCEATQNIVHAPMAGNQVISQSFGLCERAHLVSMTFQYRSLINLEGAVEIRKQGSEEVLVSLPFVASATANMTPLFIESLDDIEFQPQTTYEFSFVTSQGSSLPESIQLFYASNDPYAHGSLATMTNEIGADLTFEIEVFIPENDANLADDSFEIFSNHPSHECMVSQPFHNYNNSFVGPMEVVIETPVCNDGKFQAIYFPGHISGDTVGFELRNDAGKVFRTGELGTSADHAGTLIARLNELPVLSFCNYELVITIPEGTVLHWKSSTHDEHSGLHAHVNGVSSATHLCYVAAMRPYAFDFEVAEHARDQLDVNIYPNPFITEFSVNLDPKTSGIAHISVHNSQDHQLFSEEVQVEEGCTSNIQVLPSGQLTRGYYTLRVEFGDQIYVETIVKQ